MRGKISPIIPATPTEWRDMADAPKSEPIVIAYRVPEYKSVRGYSLASWSDEQEAWLDEFGDFIITDPAGWVHRHHES